MPARSHPRRATAAPPLRRASGRPPAAATPAVDVQALAERVYRLLRAELRVERERLGPRARRR
ncbi:MAG: hypothetical protein JNK29_19120 [Anaerolineales bacterium]|nr:hypothetical protein [Anaerolineales bacterium]